MSLYQLQKFLYDINRDPLVQDQFRAGREGLAANAKLVVETALKIDKACAKKAIPNPSA